MNLRIDRIFFCAAHYLRGHGKCGRVHGHTYAIRDLKVFGNVGENGMIVDFGELKAVIKHHFDHKLIVPKEDEKKWRKALKDLNLPLDIVAIDGQPTVENIAKEIYKLLREYYPDCYFTFALYEGPNEGVYVG